MKIYLDNNLGVKNVEQEELTQDTIGYNILKVYIPNAVLTPYNTFTCYYGALLQNGRKVGWFAMEARTSSDADYEANYTLYKATLEQCVVSVEGKVYIGCQILLGNSGNATLIKKNTAVVQFNVRKSVAINNDILVLDPDQTNTDVLESYKNLLKNALTTYATKATTYTKTEVDSALALKADKSNTYTKAEVYTKTEVDGKLDLKADKSDTYTKTEVDTMDLNLAGQIAGARVELNNRINTTNNILVETNARITANADDIDTLEGNVSTLQNNTYSKTEVDEKIDDISAYIKSEIDTMINAKADKTTVEGINTRVGALETDIADLESVQNVVDVVATKSALNSYDTTKLDANDKVQVIADETHDGASTIYNWNGSAWQYVGAFGTNSYTKDETYTKQETLEQIDIHKLINKTYSELATLKANNGLVAGQKYRITDYVTKTNGKCNGVENDAISTEHPFDVIVTAISNNEFSENARAIHHTGANYFSQSKLEAWRLWYSFDNDIYRFEWADTRNGKGVIYRMIDEFQNDLPYDFKNIQFKRYKITGVTDQRQSSLIGKYLGFYENYNVTSDSNDYVWRYTFSKRADNSDLSLFEIDSSTFNQNSYVKQVVIGEYITDNPTYRCKQALNNIVMEVEALIVDVQMGKGSHHNTWIGNEDIDYCYFNAMFRQNILYGEINHTRADECFEKNVIGDGAFTTYASCWNKFSHHFSRNIGIDMQSNDFEGQVGETKFPLHFTRNHISNMWDDVNASSHTTFNRCEFGYVVTATFGGSGTWDGVKSIMLWNTTININNLFGTTLGRLEYVTISQGTNRYNILNLTTGALNGSSGKPLIINLSDISNLLATSFEKNITFAWHNLLNAKCLVYSVKVYDKINNLVYDTNYAGIINTANNNVTWEEVGDIGQLKALVNTKADTSYVDGKFEEVGQMFEVVGNEVLKKANAEYISKGTTLTQTSYSNTNPSKSGKVKLYKLGGMSYKVNGTIQHSAVYAIHSMNGSNIYNNLSIPNEIQNLTGYGWGIDNTCYNYIDFATKKFVQKVGRVDLGTLTWNYNALGEPSYFYASIANAVNSINVSCSLYESAVVLPTNTEDKIICITQNQVRIRDNELEGSIVDLNTKLNGVYLYYERATPIETDISSYISNDTLEVVEGGTLEFLNTYNQAVPNEIAYIFNAVTLNNIVDSNGNTNVIATKQELNEKSKVVANPTLAGTEADLTGLQVDGAKYKVGGGGKLYYVVTSDDITDFTPLGSSEFEITLSEELENVITDFKQGIYIDWATLFPDIPYSFNVCCYVPTKKFVVDGKIHYLLSCVDSFIDSTLSFYKVDNQWKLSMMEANLVDRETLNCEVSQLTNAIDGKSKVVANPTLSGDEATLEGAEIDGVKYKVGGGSGKLYLHKIRIKKTNIIDTSSATIGFNLHLLYSIVTSSNKPIEFNTFMNITHFDNVEDHYGMDITGDITISNNLRALNSFCSYSKNNRAKISYIDSDAVLIYASCVFNSVDIIEDIITEV